MLKASFNYLICVSIPMFALTSCLPESEQANNSKPVANAGLNKNITTGSTVVLNGANSFDTDGDKLSFSWSLIKKPAKSLTTLTNPLSVMPSFVADSDGIYVISLIVNDGTTNSLASNVTVTATKANSAPVANAGQNQQVATGSLVSLSGANSTDVDGDQLSFEWTWLSKPQGSIASLSNSLSATTSFTADMDGSYVIGLVVFDGSDQSEQATVTVMAENENSAPVANAGIDQNIVTGSLVSINGSGSTDADSDTLTYAWSLTTRPEGSSAVLTNLTAIQTDFTADVDGIYVVQLIVNDGNLSSQADTIIITAETINSVPVANAGVSQSSVVNRTIYLDGSASTDADGDSLSYLWSFIAKPEGSLASFDLATAMNPSFIADSEGTYVVSLVVNDGLAQSQAVTVSIEVIVPHVKLFRKTDSFINSTFNSVALPFSTSGAITTNVSGIPQPTTYTLATFKLSSHGGDFTLGDLTSTDSTANVAPFFTNLSENYVVADGEEVIFQLISPLTGNKTVSLNFSFKIIETDQSFNASYTFRSN